VDPLLLRRQKPELLYCKRNIVPYKSKDFISDFHFTAKNTNFADRIKNEKIMDTSVKTQKKQHNNLKSITLFYNEKNNVALNTIDYLLMLGVFKKPKKVKSPLELALEDVKHGRVTRIKNIDNFKNECLK